MKTIRKASYDDVPDILAVYESARVFMRETGNRTQWTGGYPSREIVQADIARECLYLCEENGVLLGVFYYAEAEDPTYSQIDDGAWLNDRPYAVMHRVAVSEQGRGRGVAGFMFDACFARCSNLRIDTHRDNHPMRRALEKNGFCYCGIIHLLNGEERMAYQRC